MLEAVRALPGDRSDGSEQVVTRAEAAERAARPASWRGARRETAGGPALLVGAGEPSEAAATGLRAAVLRPAKSCLLEGRPERIRELAPEATGFALATRRHAGGAGRPGARAGDGPEGAGTPLARHTDGEPSEATTLGPLPTGRHGMTRAAVRHSQRERLLAGVVAAVAERGYPETRIGDVVARAEVSRRVFYEHFESVEECFLCAVEIVATHLGEIAAAAAEKADASPKAVTALRAVLDFLADEPDLARACMVESLDPMAAHLSAGVDPTPV